MSASDEPRESYSDDALSKNSMRAAEDLHKLLRAFSWRRDEAIEEAKRLRLELIELRYDYQTLADRLHAVEGDRNEDYLL